MRNTLTLKGFILDSLFFYFVGYIWYYAIFFKTIANMSVLHSNLLLLLFLVCFYIVNFVITSKWDRNSKNIIAIMLVGYAYYTYLSYGKYLSNIFIVVGIVGAILIVLYGIWVFGRKIPGTKSFEKMEPYKLTIYFEKEMQFCVDTLEQGSGLFGPVKILYK